MAGDPNTPENRISGEVVETLPSLRFRVRLDDGREIFAYLSGKLVVHRIKILPGDRVTVETTPYDPGKGRIVYREKK